MRIRIRLRKRIDNCGRPPHASLDSRRRPWGTGRTANSLSKIDLVLISSQVNKASLASAWFYLPRTLAKNALVLWADGTLPDGEYREVPAAELGAAALLPAVFAAVPPK